MMKPHSATAELSDKKNAVVPAILLPEHIAGPWTEFYDMSSGGRTKIEPFTQIYIQANEADARKFFQEIFDRHPDHVTCDCCGEDYSVEERKDLLDVTGHDRHCAYSDEEKRFIEERRKYPNHPGYEVRKIEDHIRLPHVLVIFSHLLTPNSPDRPKHPIQGILS
jgi:hypothetical protein